MSSLFFFMVFSTCNTLSYYFSNTELIYLQHDTCNETFPGRLR